MALEGRLAIRDGPLACFAALEEKGREGGREGGREK